MPNPPAAPASPLLIVEMYEGSNACLNPRRPHILPFLAGSDACLNPHCTGNPLLWWGFPVKTRLRKLSVPETGRGETEVG